ncbi:MAG TPA: hypothetical protein DCR14_12585 [Acidimicrobiaceae bacterium]|nr:hypothetical protein [Acidimicrobiaceae bacterium]
MSLLDAFFILLAGIGAGTINAVVGSGSLITFPTLVALGYPPLLSNVSNNVGLVPGSLSAVYGYRRELVGQMPRLRRLVPASLVGAATGSTLLLVLPSDVFDVVVIVLVALALVLVVTGPRISAWVARRRGEGHPGHTTVTMPLIGLVAAAGVYGGYFGAAQGIILTATLGVFVDDHLQRLNACKNVLALTVNTVAAVVFIASTSIDWKVVGVIAVGSTIGGLLGSRYGRRLPPNALRAVIVAVGLVALVRLLA